MAQLDERNSIPEVMKTELFESAKMSKVLVEEQMGGKTYLSNILASAMLS